MKLTSWAVIFIASGVVFVGTGFWMIPDKGFSALPPIILGAWLLLNGAVVLICTHSDKDYFGKDQLVKP